MLKLLIVDDELYAIRAMLKAVDFAALGFAEVYTALGANEAKQKLQTHAVDLMICDIEMPGTNGLELTEWVNDHFPDTITVFLTGHAEFSYAQKAIRLGSFDYLLKPVKTAQLEAVLKRTAAKIGEDREAEQLVESAKKYRSMWQRQRAVVVERYWQHLLSGRAVPSGPSLQAVHLPLEPGSPVLPILISIERWHKEFSPYDEEILEYALRNAASELMLGECRGDIVKDANGILLALAYGVGDCPLEPCEFEDACRSFIEASGRYFYCSVSCYIGVRTTVVGLTDVYHRLLELEQSNIAHSGTVQRLDESQVSPGAGAKTPIAIPWSDWVVLFETGNKRELLGRLDQLLGELQEAHDHAESASALYHALLYMIYHVAHKNGLSVKEWAGLRERSDEQAAIRSIAHLRSWSEWLIDAASDHMERQRGESSALIAKTKAYIKANLKEVTREKAAASIYLNPAYLSRVFKRETGQALIDYIIHEKMERAKLLLAETNDKITDICEEIGYENYSHFGQAFKKKVGIAPHEFRKRYRQLGENNGR
ncbi:response regulator transcription factor [Paenibacillus cymbidii]|uniref:response regulator transcription factor n=1 Tax=Paenibacillus cymbidii TaxID=1639034 RepID=UPI001436BA8C|nr:response regulator [Paenibacillus cymbidii]